MEISKHTSILRFRLFLAIIFFLAGGLQIFPAPAKETIAVIDFNPKGALDAEADVVTNEVRLQLFRSNKYKIVERENIEKLYNEQKMQMSGLTGKTFAIQMGKILSAQHILLGSVSKIDKSYFVTARMINVSTGEMEFGDSVQVGDSTQLLQGARKLAASLTGNKKQNVIKTRQTDIEEAIDFHFSRLDVSWKKFKEKHHFKFDRLKEFGIYGRGYLKSSLHEISYDYSGIGLGFAGKGMITHKSKLALGLGGSFMWLLRENKFNIKNDQENFYYGHGGLVFSFLQQVNESLILDYSVLIGAGHFEAFVTKNGSYVSNASNTFPVLEFSVGPSLMLSDHFGLAAILSYTQVFYSRDPRPGLSGVYFGLGAASKLEFREIL